MMTAGLMTPVKGSYKLFGMETQTFGEAELAERLRVGFVFEGGHLFNHLTVRENVALPLQYHRDLPSAAAAQEVQTLLELMELTPLADITPPNISDNWRQRAALARALILKPEVLLLDNPLGRPGRAAPALVAAFSRPARARTRVVRRQTDDAGRDHGRFASLAGTRSGKFALLRDKKFFAARFVERGGIGKRPGRERIAGRPG